MDEISAPRIVEVDPSKNLNDLLASRVAADPAAPMVARRTGADGAWQALSAREFDAEVVAVAKGLVARGIQPGDHVGIMSRTRYEWTLLDWATWAAGAVPVPLYETSSPEQVQWILSDADVRLLVVETEAHAATVEEVRDQAPALQDVLAIDAGAIATLT
ncbi:MAG: AMP-binding protein, partial [Cellulosimicrobium funkei]